MLTSFDMKPIIEIKNVGKSYTLGEAQKYYALRDVMVGLFRRKFTKKDFWALEDVSLDVAHGETVGVIGRNGAGKSTLLKILSRITPPTTGHITMRGRTASLLEVGTGFNPELTGRENIYLNGAVLGMSRAEINKKFDEIVAFSEISQFLDTPAKRYSSGMYVRLAFAVAAHLEPEILIVDEVLAVGDVAFQQKCLGKMSDVAHSGRTVLFVSHNMGAVKRLCRRCVWLDKGQVRMVGETEEVVAKYLGECMEAQAVNSYPEDPSKKVQIRKIAILDKDGVPCTDVDVSRNFFIEVEYDVREDIQKRNYVCLTLRDSSDGILLQSFDLDSNEGYYETRGRGKYRVVFEFPADVFNQQSCRISVQCGIPLKYNFDPDRQQLVDQKDNVALNLFKSVGFSNQFFGGGRNGPLLMKIESQIIKERL